MSLINREELLNAFGLSEKTRKYGGDHSGYDTRMLYEIQDTIEGTEEVEAIPIKDLKRIAHDLRYSDDITARIAGCGIYGIVSHWEDGGWRMGRLVDIDAVRYPLVEMFLSNAMSAANAHSMIRKANRC